MRSLSEPLFAIDVHQNEYLPDGAREVSAVLTVTSGADLAQPDDVAAAEIIIIDCSGSMARRNKIDAAREATAAAVDAIGDGVAFAVIAGTSKTRMVFPADVGLAVAGAQSRDLAKRAVAGLRARGGTRIGEWLRLAHQLFSGHAAGLRHAILLTDGQNGETSRRLDEAISLCAGVFSCDCRGVGTGWNVSELRKIATALLGTVDIVADPAGLTADFAAMMRSSMSKQVADVALRVWVPGHADIRFVKQVAHYTGQAELAEAIQDGLRARKAGDEETATARLGRAVALAAQSGNEDTARLLAKVVDVVDPVTGTVRLRKQVADADEMALDTRSVKTIKTRQGRVDG